MAAIMARFSVAQLLAVFCLLLSRTTALVTLPNNVHKYDSAGNVLDVHDGKMYYFDGMYYLYGTSSNCGFRWRTSNYSSPFCGFKSYSSADLLTWKDEGFLFDASTHYWQHACADTAACFRPKVLQHPKTGQYIMWMNSGASNWSYTVFTSSTPTGPYTEVNKPEMPYARGNTSYGNGDFGIHIGPDGTGYIVYDTTPYVTGPPLFSSPNITYGVVQQLTPNYTATEKAYVVTDLTNIEAWDIFYREGWWYLTFGHICGYCDATDTSYIKSRDPLGPWLEENRVRITDSSCGGQHNMVAQLPASNEYRKRTGDDYVWLYGSDLWIGEVNEGKAGHHWEPLTFLDNGDIRPLDCYAPQYDLDILSNASQVVDVVSHATVSSAAGNYSWNCGLGVRNQNFIYQFFQAPKSGLVSEMGLNIAQQANDAPFYLYFGEATNATALFSPAGGVKNLYAATLPVDSIGWSLPMVTAKPNVTVTEGNYYAIYMTTNGGITPYCYLEHETDYAVHSNIFQPPTSFLAEIQQGRYPLFPLVAKEMRYYVQID